jgi:hypothetical protein
VYAGCDFVRRLQVNGEKLPPRLRIKHQPFRCLCRSTENGRTRPCAEDSAEGQGVRGYGGVGLSRSARWNEPPDLPHIRRCRREARDGQTFRAIKVLLYLGRAMADTAHAARPGCDKFKTSCLIPLNSRKRLEER